MTGSQALIAPLVAFHLVVLTAVAGLPALLLASNAPQPRQFAFGAEAGPPLQVVRSGAGRWFLNGQPIAEAALARVLRQRGEAKASVRFQASGRLSAHAVSSSMAWLRRVSGRPVSLDLPVALP